MGTISNILLFCLYVGAYSFPVNWRDMSRDKLNEEASKYLERYGYVDQDKYYNDLSWKVTALARFQYFTNLPVTGELDDATLKQMSLSRCGMADPDVNISKSALDNIAPGLRIHVKRNLTNRLKFVHQGTTWKKMHLTWMLTTMPRGPTYLRRNTIRRTMQKACDTWSAVTNIYVREIFEGEPDIEVKFASYDHGDGYPFDGPGGTIAHSFYPMDNVGLAGDMHMDDSESFTLKSPKGFNLAWTMLHELGHGLGLEHSHHEEAIMWPYIPRWKPGTPQLAYDDIAGIQTLYGGKIHTTVPKPTTSTKSTSKTTKNPITTVPTPTRPRPTTPCPRLPIGAIYDLPSIGHRLFISGGGGEQLYFFKKDRIEYGPLETINYFPKKFIPGSIDAAFTVRSKKFHHETVIFSGPMYYIYSSFGFKSGPHCYKANASCHHGNPMNFKFPDWVNKIDAAMRWYKDDKVYLFVKKTFWRYDDEKNRFDEGYPKVTKSVWKGLPLYIDSAYSSKADQRTFFIAGDRFYKIDERTGTVEKGFPQYIGDAWLNCK